MARSHHTTIHKINTSIRNFASVYQQACSPSLVRLYPAITTKNAVKHYHGTRYFCSRTKEKKIISFDRTAIKKYLLTATIQISRFCSSYGRKIMNDADIIN